jgi:hypothetical protein
VTALDPYGNRATSYRGTIHFTSSDKKARLPANYTFTSADNGAHTFQNGATLKTVGTQSITATDTVVSSITGSISIKVSASALMVSGFFSPFAQGSATLDPIGTQQITSADTRAPSAIPVTADSTQRVFETGLGSDAARQSEVPEVTFAELATALVHRGRSSARMSEILFGSPDPLG